MKDSKFLRALNLQPNTTPPVWFMRQAGRYLPEYQKIRKNYSNFEEIYNSKLASPASDKLYIDYNSRKLKIN